MKTKAIHILMLLAAISLACIACSDETAPQPVPDGGGQLRIAYKIAGTSMSRATEDGWGDEDEDGTDEWRENIISRLDLFIFNENNTFFRHLDSDDLTMTIDPDEDGYTVAETQELTYADVTDDKKYYMVVNCPQLDNWTGTLEDLQKVMINPDLECDAYQLMGFVMDGEGNLTKNGELSTLTFNLSRAAAKIRLTVKDNEGNNITEQCQYSFQNYVSTGTSVLAESEKYGEGKGQELQSAEIETPLMYNDTKKGMQAVFYSYPNDWFDDTLLDGNGEFIDKDIYAKDDLIDEERQTHILLTYDKNQFKVPVNFAISPDNDKVSFTKEEIEDLRDNYYRIRRNYIYDVTVKIDMTTEEVKLEDIEILVNAWNEKENMEVIFGGK